MARCWAVGIWSPISTRGCICRSRVCGITLYSFLTWHLCPTPLLGHLGFLTRGPGGQPVPHKGECPQGPVSRRDFSKTSRKGPLQAECRGRWPQAPHQVRQNGYGRSASLSLSTDSKECALCFALLWAWGTGSPCTLRALSILLALGQGDRSPARVRASVIAALSISLSLSLACLLGLWRFKGPLGPKAYPASAKSVKPFRGSVFFHRA